MPKSLVLGNGNILIGLDKFAQVHDFYYPHVGLEEQVGKHLPHKLGVFVGTTFSWLDDGEWEISIDYQPETLASKIEAFHHRLKIKLEFRDVVYNETDIFIREVVVYNLGDERRMIKLFFHQKFELSESYRADTAFFDPVRHVMVHYKGKRAFLINAISDMQSFDDFSIGNFYIEGKEGTYKDAEDGMLSKNAIEHGMVDSVIGFSSELEADASTTIYYWVAAGRNLKEVHQLNEYVLKKTPQHLMRTTIDFWRAWVNKQEFNFYNLDPQLIALFKKSLLITRIQVDNHGAIIASCDADMLKYGKDNYSYMWPRDGALVAEAIDSVGDNNVAQRFFEFCNNVITPEGYFMHKYLADESLASSWHPWVREGQIELPIQEDETALVIVALRHHFELTKDLEFIEKNYNSLIRAAADFMTDFRDKHTGLPKASYDLWEEKFGTHTFTSAAVYAALLCAADFAKMLGKADQAERFSQAAEEIKQGILTHLYNEEEGYFYKSIVMRDDGSYETDRTVDNSSVYGIFKFQVLEMSDERLQRAIEVSQAKTAIKKGIGGFSRYEHDAYYRVSHDEPGNPWNITSCWMAQYMIVAAQLVDELQPALDLLGWVLKYATPAGVLAEQLNPETGEHLSASPLTWSSAEFITTVLLYIKKMEQLGRQH